MPASSKDYVGKPVMLGIRAENIEVIEEAVEGDTLKARVLVVEPLGSHDLLTAKLGSEQHQGRHPAGHEHPGRPGHPAAVRT